MTSRNGVSWHSQAIPGAPEPTFAHLGLQLRGGVLAMLGQTNDPTRFGGTTTPNGALYAWTASTVAGLTVGSTAFGTGESAQLGSVWKEGDHWTGRVSFAGETGRHDGGLIRGTGAAGPWSYVACAPTSHCAEGLTGAGLTFRGDEVSTDRGRHWKRWRIIPTPARELEEVSFASVTRVGGAWVATASAAPPSDRAYGFLVRSVDGRHWRSLIADPCPRRANGRPPISERDRQERSSLPMPR